MAALHDFHCTKCDVIFEDIGTYNRALGSVEPVPCPLCDEPAGRVWLKAPGVAGDENISAEEKVAAALKLGIFADGKLSVPQTRSDLKKIKAAYGDLKVGEKELLTLDKRRERTAEERETQKRIDIENIRQRRAKRRAGELPPLRKASDTEITEAIKSQPLMTNRILSKNGARK